MKFEEVLEKYKVPVAPPTHHHARSGWLNFDCPFCGSGSEKWHMGYNLYGKYCNCWSCGPKRLIDVVMALTGLRFHDAKKALEGLERDTSQENAVEGKLSIPPGVGKLWPGHIRYLRSRGFKIERLKRLWGIQGIGVSSELSWRIFIPIHYQGKMVSWTTRTTDKYTTPKYYSARPDQEDIPHKQLLYGEDYCRHSIIVVEGPLDVWRIGPGAVATLGTGYSRAQMAKMSKYPKRIICFDNEPAAQKRARDLCDQLEVFPGETMNAVLRAKDPGEADDEELEELRSLL